MPVHAGDGVELDPVKLGEKGGNDAVTPADPKQTRSPETRPFLSVNFCIALEGTYPSRS